MISTKPIVCCGVCAHCNPLPQTAPTLSYHSPSWSLLLRWVLFDVGEVGVCIVAPGSPPRDVRARPVSSSTVVVQWNEPEIPNGVIRVRSFYILPSILT